MSPQLITIIIGMIITVPSIFGMWIYSQNMDKKKSVKRFGDKGDDESKVHSNSRKKKTPLLKGHVDGSGRESIGEKVGIAKINSNMIFECDGNLSVIIEYSTPDISSLKDEEVEGYEEALRMAAVALKHHLKVIEFAGGTKTVQANRKIMQTIESGILNEPTMAYALQLSNALSAKQYDLEEVEKRKFFIVSANGGSEEKSLQDLKKRVGNLVTNLDKAKTKCTLLDTTAEIDLLNEILSNSTSRLDVDKAEKSGVFELYASGTVRRN